MHTLLSIFFGNRKTRKSEKRASGQAKLDAPGVRDSGYAHLFKGQSADPTRDAFLSNSAYQTRMKGLRLW